MHLNIFVIAVQKKCDVCLSPLLPDTNRWKWDNMVGEKSYILANEETLRSIHELIIKISFVDKHNKML